MQEREPLLLVPKDNHPSRLNGVVIPGFRAPHRGEDRSSREQRGISPALSYKFSTTERFKSFAYEDLLKRDKVNLDIFWLKDQSPEDAANLPDPDVIAAEIAEDLQAALDQFSQTAADLKR